MQSARQEPHDFESSVSEMTIGRSTQDGGQNLGPLPPRACTPRRPRGCHPSAPAAPAVDLDDAAALHATLLCAPVSLGTAPSGTTGTPPRGRDPDRGVL